MSEIIYNMLFLSTRSDKLALKRELNSIGRTTS